MRKSLRRIKHEVQQESASVCIGKNGLTESVLKEIDNQLKRKKVLKVRVHRAALESSNMDRKEVAKYVASKLGAKLLEVRGRTFVLYREKP